MTPISFPFAEAKAIFSPLVLTDLSWSCDEIEEMDRIFFIFPKFVIFFNSTYHNIFSFFKMYKFNPENAETYS